MSAILSLLAIYAIMKFCDYKEGKLKFPTFSTCLSTTLALFIALAPTSSLAGSAECAVMGNDFNEAHKGKIEFNIEPGLKSVVVLFKKGYKAGTRSEMAFNQTLHQCLAVMGNSYYTGFIGSMKANKICHVTNARRGMSICDPSPTTFKSLVGIYLK